MITHVSVTPYVLQQAPQRGARMVQVRPRRPLGNPEHLADLAVRVPFHIVQDDHRALSIREMGERLGKSPPQLIRLAGIPEGQGNRLRQLVRVAYLAPPDQVQRRVRHDAVEPGAEWLVGSESLQRAIRVKKPFLNSILGILVGEHDRSRDRVRPPLMSTNQLRECFAASSLGGQYELALARPIIWHVESAANAGARGRPLGRGSGGRDHLPDVLLQVRVGSPKR
jgi:hypothetical protein